MNLKLMCTTAIVMILIACSEKNSSKNSLPKTAEKTRAARLLNEFIHGDEVLVVAHRGDWRNACENSITAINNAIAMGVDMVEIDLKKTADNELILMHDKTLNRTTTGKGRVKEHTLKAIKKLYLKDGAGHKTGFRVPTLKEALLVSKGKVLLNLDQSFDYFEEVLPILKETKTMSQIVIKGYHVPLDQVKSKMGTYYDSIQYMPIVKLGSKNYLKQVQEVRNNGFEAVEFTFALDTFSVVDEFDAFQKRGTRVWVNSLWPEHNAGHHDDRALTDPEGSYGWLVSKGVNIIQTDRPQLLLNYLKKSHTTKSIMN